jgi:predicted GIY-YIG superfamily endonuclease
MPDYAYVYILASSFKHLYIGFTTNLEQRIWQHKNHTFPDSFTSRYRIDQLVYFERYSRSHVASPAKRNSKAGEAARRSPSSLPPIQAGKTSAGNAVSPSSAGLIPNHPHPQLTGTHPANAALQQKAPATPRPFLIPVP